MHTVKSPSRITRTYAAIGAIFGWFAIFGQLYLSLSVRTVSVAELLLRFIGYFTITTNTLAALCFTAFWLQGNTFPGRQLRKPAAVFAIAVFIVIVGVVYNLVLRSLWRPQGLQLVIDELLHSVQPVLFLLFWLIFVPKAGLKVQQFFPWLFYPLMYILYVVLLGAFTGHYPYPFADVSRLGYPRALLNAAGMLCAFLLLAYLLLGMVRLRKIKG